MSNPIQERIEQSFRAQSLMVTLGASLAHVGDGVVKIGLPFGPGLLQQHGYLHAGVVTSIVDSACGYAALTKAPAGFEVVTAEFKINLLRPAIGERFLATGRVQHAGRTLTVCVGEVWAYAGGQQDHKVVALMQATIANVAK